MPTREEIIVRHLTPLLAARQQVLEIGAGNGLVAQMLHLNTGAEFTLLDVVDYNRSQFPLHLYDGRALPFEAKSFDFALLVFVLHHNPDPRPVLREALRVSRRGVLVVENDVRGRLRKPLTRMIDSAEHLRRGVPPCYFTKSREEWLDLFREMSARAELLSTFRIGWFWNNAVLSLSHPML